MITVPTGEFTGLLSDAIPFALDDPDLPVLSAIRLTWDGGMLHAAATDRFRLGKASWHPEDRPDHDVQESLLTAWGGEDEPWEILLPTGEAKALVKAYKLHWKEGRTPLTIDLHDGWLDVHRGSDTGYSALTFTIRGTRDVDGSYPDIDAVLGRSDRVIETRTAAYTASYLASFAKVRPRGAMELTFAGAEGLTLVSIGNRFVGAIQPVKLGDES